MTTTVARMTKDELREMIGELIERKPLELFGDPDEGKRLQASLRRRLARQKLAVAKGERGEPLEPVAKRLGLD
ncbi:MAG: hypothetical protein HYX97_02855 [Chloroflexi bacterium]|nr:hypothetical protein [Chloroflexota bacterium]